MLSMSNMSFLRPKLCVPRRSHGLERAHEALRALDEVEEGEVVISRFCGSMKRYDMIQIASRRHIRAMEGVTPGNSTGVSSKGQRVLPTGARGLPARAGSSVHR